MSAGPASDLAAIAEHFSFSGRLVALSPIGSGNINDTYLVVFRTPLAEERGILQRINRRVFKNPAAIMDNMRLMTEHVRLRIEREADGADRVWQVPRVISAKDGKNYHIDSAGEWWRAMTAIASAVSHDRALGPAHAKEAGTVLGQFHRLVSDLQPALLQDTLPGFHVTPTYLKTYDDLRTFPGVAARLKEDAETRRLARFIDDRRDLASVLEDARERGELSVRLIHGDPKVNNIMIDEVTGKGTSIVDLDTVKPGLIHYDFGDALRSICNPAGEDASDLKKVVFDAGFCSAFVEGYMSRAKDFMTAADRKYLFDSIRLIAFELGLRFFEDHLAGDIYFKTRFAGHNLKRAAVQLRLCASIEENESRIRKILQRY